MSYAKLQADAARWGWMRSIYVRVMQGLSAYLGIHLCVVRATPIVEDPHYPTAPTHISLRELSNQDLLEATQIPELELCRDFVEAADERGDLAFGAFDGPELVALVWRTLAAAPHIDGLSVRVNRPYNYVYKSFTRPSHRGQHLGPTLILYSDLKLLKLGYTHRAGFIDTWNLASLATGKHMGSRFLGYAGYVKWFGRYFPFRSPAVKNIGFEFFEEK